MVTLSDQKKHSRYIDRDFSWLAFNERVFCESRNDENPLLERIKFLSIVANNMDEFFEVRIAALLQKIEFAIPADGIAEMDCSEKLKLLLQRINRLNAQQYQCWNEELLPLLEAENIRIKDFSDLHAHETAALQHYFLHEVYPLLTPIKVDPAHPFPRLLNKALCMAVFLGTDSQAPAESLGIITVPRSLPRLIRIPGNNSQTSFIFLYEIIRHFVQELFKGYSIQYCTSFRITRNSNLYLDSDDNENLIEAVESVVHDRRKGDVVRLEIEKDAPELLIEALMAKLDLVPFLVFRVNGPVNLNRLMGLYQALSSGHLKYPIHIPINTLSPSSLGIFEQIKQNDILLHHPFESYDPVVEFIKSAAKDPTVLAIKQTLYRTSLESPIMRALQSAAEQEKEVVAIVELQARFDEKSNINWARQLEEKGGTVLYGVVGYKTHCKITLITRREGSELRIYAHIGTGNYNPDTAKFYTDLSFFTCAEEITAGVGDVFNFLSAYSNFPDFKSLLVAPVNLLNETLRLIKAETEWAKENKPTLIMAKMNALVDAELIEALYAASQAGVTIRLIVRGICSLRPGIKGLSENIEVISVVGRYLEHSRIFCYGNQGEPLLFLGSADWMKRNLRDRVEVLVPITQADLKSRMEAILELYWADTAKSHSMQSDGQYKWRREEKNKIDAQKILMSQPPLIASSFLAEFKIQTRKLVEIKTEHFPITENAQQK